MSEVLSAWGWPEGIFESPTYYFIKKNTSFNYNINLFIFWKLQKALTGMTNVYMRKQIKIMCTNNEWSVKSL